MSSTPTSVLRSGSGWSLRPRYSKRRMVFSVKSCASVHVSVSPLRPPGDQVTSSAGTSRATSSRARTTTCVKRRSAGSTRTSAISPTTSLVQCTGAPRTTRVPSMSGFSPHGRSPESFAPGDAAEGGCATIDAWARGGKEVDRGRRGGGTHRRVLDGGDDSLRLAARRRPPARRAPLASDRRRARTVTTVTSPSGRGPRRARARRGLRLPGRHAPQRPTPPRRDGRQRCAHDDEAAEDHEPREEREDDAEAPVVRRVPREPAGEQKARQESQPDEAERDEERAGQKVSGGDPSVQQQPRRPHEVGDQGDDPDRNGQQADRRPVADLSRLHEIERHDADERGEDGEEARLVSQHRGARTESPGTDGRELKQPAVSGSEDDDVRDRDHRREESMRGGSDEDAVEERRRRRTESQPPRETVRQPARVAV